MEQLNIAKAYNKEGTSLLHLGKYEAAIEAFENAINMDPACSLSYYNKSRALFAVGKYEVALKANDRALQLNPNCSLALGQKIIVLSAMKNMKKNKNGRKARDREREGCNLF